jgi:hypothetical protein
MKEGQMAHSAVLLAISTSTNVDHLRHYMEAARDRIKTLAKVNTAEISVGDTIKFTPEIHPTYLSGLTAKVTRINDQTITVETPQDARYRRFSGGRGIRVSRQLVEAA